MKSNLGMYKVMTTLAKKVGGPVPLAIGTMVVGYAGGKAAEYVTGKVISRVKRSQEAAETIDSEAIYTVSVNSRFEDEVSFTEGDCFRIVAKDEDALIIEIIGAERNPYLVSEEWLKAVSNYEPKAGASKRKIA